MILEVTRAYSEPHRAYHVLSHPVGMIELGNKVFDAGLTAHQILAIWYHDYVYKAGSPTNEQDSANIFYEHYLYKQGINTDRVMQMILDTKNHVPSDPESCAVIDLDLIGLSDTPRNYRQNAVNVRKEYCEFSDEDWKVGRTKFLEKMLGKEHIYYTHFGQAHTWSACHNMDRELKMLNEEGPVAAALFYNP